MGKEFFLGEKKTDIWSEMQEMREKFVNLISKGGRGIGKALVVIYAKEIANVKCVWLLNNKEYKVALEEWARWKDNSKGRGEGRGRQGGCQIKEAL